MPIGNRRQMSPCARKRRLEGMWIGKKHAHLLSWWPTLAFAGAPVGTVAWSKEYYTIAISNCYTPCLEVTSGILLAHKGRCEAGELTFELLSPSPSDGVVAVLVPRGEPWGVQLGV